MARKTHDLAVVVREYQDRDGQTKKQYQNVGALMEGDNGPYVILERWFNPAGIANPQDRSNLIVSCFEPRSREDNGNRQQSARQASYDAQRPQSGGYGGAANLDEGEIPFAPCVLL